MDRYKITISYIEEYMDQSHDVNRSMFVKGTNVLWKQDFKPNKVYTIALLTLL